MMDGSQVYKYGLVAQKNNNWMALPFLGNCCTNYEATHKNHFVPHIISH